MYIKQPKKFKCIDISIDFVYLGEKLFINSENQTFRAWEYRESILIPCPVTDPRPNITLLQYSNDTVRNIV